jgi:RNA polymerase sigma-70 factor (ECF subfamily)
LRGGFGRGAVTVLGEPVLASAHDPSGWQQQLALARQGEDAARGQLLEGYRAYLQLLARVEIGLRLQTKLDTEDLIQETFLEAHRNFAAFRGNTEAEFVAWLRSILGCKTANTVRHYWGTQGRDPRREMALDADLDRSSRLLDRGLMALDTSPSLRVARREQGVLLAEGLARLPADYREVIVLRHLEELTFPAVAERMQRSVDSVQKLWVRALAQLRLVMKDSE